MLNTSHVALLHTFQSKSSNQSSTNTRTIFGCQYLNWVFLLGVLLLRPIQDLAQRNGTSLLEVGVFVEDGAVGTYVASLVVLLLGNCCDTTCRKTSSSRTDQFSETTNEFEFCPVGDEAQLVLEEICGL